jgi:hypothetical protein
MAPPERSHKRKQLDTPTGDPSTLLSFFASKRLKRNSAVSGLSTGLLSDAKEIGAATNVIVISDDEDSRAPLADDILDLSFSDPMELQDRPQITEDDLVEATDVPQSNTIAIDESAKCLGNQLMASAVELGTCRICGLVLLDSTEKVCILSSLDSYSTDKYVRKSMNILTNASSNRLGVIAKMLAVVILSLPFHLAVGSLRVTRYHKPRTHWIH